MKLLIIQPSPASCHFFPLRSIYSPQQPVLKYALSLKVFEKRVWFRQKHQKELHLPVCWEGRYATVQHMTAEEKYI
jgi:hypothetical protein